MDPQTFLRFNREVRRSLFETLSTLPAEELVADVGISFGSLRNTLFHVMRVEDFWVNVFLRDGEPMVSRNDRDVLETAEDLAVRWDQVSAETEAYIRGLSEEDLASTRERQGDDVVRKTVEEYLFTFMIHEVYHKGEVLAVLWQRGVEPPPVDYWRY